MSSMKFMGTPESENFWDTFGRPKINTDCEEDIRKQVADFSKQVMSSIERIQSFIDTLKEIPIKEPKEIPKSPTPCNVKGIYPTLYNHKSKTIYESSLEGQYEKLRNKFKFAISAAVTERASIMRDVGKNADYSAEFYEEMREFVNKCFADAKSIYFEWTAIKSFEME